MINMLSQPLENNQRAKITPINTRQTHVGQGQGHGFSEGQGHGFSEGQGHGLHPGDFFVVEN